MTANARAVVLDFDGTVADTMTELSALAIELMTATYGVPEDGARYMYRATMGAPFPVQLDELFPGNVWNDGVARAYYVNKRKILNEAEPHLCVDLLLRRAKSRGLRTFICSSTEQDLVRAFTRRHGLELLLDGVTGQQCGDDKGRQIFDLVRHCEISADQTVFVGDAPRDGNYARYAGVEFLGVEHTFTEAEFRMRGWDSVPDLCWVARKIVRE